MKTAWLGTFLIETSRMLIWKGRTTTSNREEEAIIMDRIEIGKDLQ